MKDTQKTDKPIKFGMHDYDSEVLVDAPAAECSSDHVIGIVGGMQSIITIYLLEIFTPEHGTHAGRWAYSFSIRLVQAIIWKLPSNSINIFPHLKEGEDVNGVYSHGIGSGSSAPLFAQMDDEIPETRPISAKVKLNFILDVSMFDEQRIS